jgi:hypothetical protein
LPRRNDPRRRQSVGTERAYRPREVGGHIATWEVPGCDWGRSSKSWVRCRYGDYDRRYIGFEKISYCERCIPHLHGIILEVGYFDKAA